MRIIILKKRTEKADWLIELIGNKFIKFLMCMLTVAVVEYGTQLEITFFSLGGGEFHLEYGRAKIHIGQRFH